jgi:hypothetical protein
MRVKSLLSGKTFDAEVTTDQTQNLTVATPCRFESGPRYQ